MGVKELLLGYFIVISAVSAVITAYDKIAAKALPKKRVPENTLMYLGFMGGAAAMYMVMQIIRHKTKHKKFMVGLPVFIALHIIIAVIVYFRF